jgi:hypothetical protein
VKLQVKLKGMREEREERRTELSNELSELKNVFEEKRGALVEDQHAKEQMELSDLAAQREAFEKEWIALEEKRDEVSKQYQNNCRHYADEKSSLHATVSSLKTDIEKIKNDHKVEMTVKQKEVESGQAQLEQQKGRRLELEEHFSRVDANNAIKKQEEEKLRMAKATALLDKGATGLQKLWRGMKERALVAKMKSKAKKKKGGKKKKK